MLWFLSSSVSLAGQNAPGSNEVAIEGYDPVAYFTMADAVLGLPAISYVMLDDEWLFSSVEHKELFVANPMKYLPNYGGYCAYDPVSLGHDHAIDPQAWRIVDDKLYLFYSEATASHAIPTEIWEEVKAGLGQ